MLLNVIRSRILRLENYPELFRQVKYHKYSFNNNIEKDVIQIDKGKIMQRRRHCDYRNRNGGNVTTAKAREKIPEQRGIGQDSPEDVLNEVMLYQHFDFKPVIVTLDFLFLEE